MLYVRYAYRYGRSLLSVLCVHFVRISARILQACGCVRTPNVAVPTEIVGAVSGIVHKKVPWIAYTKKNDWNSPSTLRTGMYLVVSLTTAVYNVASDFATFSIDAGPFSPHHRHVCCHKLFLLYWSNFWIWTTPSRGCFAQRPFQRKGRLKV